ncbi:MAG: ETC complex I subunit [Caulobacteraceae bacterium]
MLARIFRPARNAMQSGKANTRMWVLDFEPAQARVPDPLMGWTITGDTAGQIRLNFASSEEAVAYAKAQGIVFELFPDEERAAPIKVYADNFAYDRKFPWTH